MGVTALYAVQTCVRRHFLARGPKGRLWSWKKVRSHTDVNLLREKGGVESKCMCSAPHCKALPTGVCYTPVLVGCARCSLYTGHQLMWSLSGWMHMENRFTYWHRSVTQRVLWHISFQVSSLWLQCKKGTCMDARCFPWAVLSVWSQPLLHH